MNRQEAPLKKAVALGYDPEKDIAPKVVAKGKGLIAENILAIAKEHNIHIQEDKQLVDYLAALDLYEEIPPVLYGVIAEIMSFIYRTDSEYQG